MASDPQTVPLDNAFLETITYQGREYQRYAVDNGAYFAPIDEVGDTPPLKTPRLAECIFQPGLFENRLLFPPITRPRRILECGFGAGDWAIDVAQQHQNCEVVAIDICPHIWPDESQTPTNLNLQVDDLNSRFTFPSNHFDLVHSQMMAGGIHSNRWRDYLRDIHRVLRPGGWCQMVEIYFNAQSDNGTLTQSRPQGADADAKLDAKCWIRLGGNPNDPSPDLRMTSQEFQVLVAQARSEADNPAFRATLGGSP
ncbi:UMTA methyltransferase [Colletotrichum nymphaeae SA-01]|uniref:UMTA methyltransferase n=1 Tax=Colletotrichum nymphaeae SA-01 TaxID=1460502 RepID=A0A135RTX5_9PEZI|nr:UMTA methyltransferase [Colletotrichum nymphaeae SA-01]